MKSNSAVLFLVISLSLLVILAGGLAWCPTGSAVEPTKRTYEDRLAEVEKLAKLQRETLAALQSRLVKLESEPRVLRAGKAVVPVKSANHGRLTVRLPDDLGFDSAKDRIVLTAELSTPNGHNYLPLLVEVKDAGFTIHVADVQSNTFTEQVVVHWLIIRQP